MLTPKDLQDQLEAACPGVLNSLGSWSDKSTWRLIFPEGATDAQKAAAQAVIDAAPAPLIMAHKSMLTATFYDRLTETELSALESSTDAIVVKWRKKLPYCGQVDIDTEESEAMQAYLVSLGLFTTGRINEIFA